MKTVLISYALIDKLGDTSGSSSGYALELQSSGVTVSNIRMANNESIGVYIIENIRPEVSQCDFENNLKDISIHPEGASNVFDNANTQVHVRSGTIDQYSEFANPGIGSNYVLEGDIVIAQGDTLKINQGVVVHFDDRNDDIIVQGTLLADGTVQDSIKFIGFENVGISSSSHGGHIDFYPQSTNSSISYALIDRLGDSSGSANGYALECQTSNVLVTNTRFRNSEYEAIHVSPNYDPEINNCVFENNTRDIGTTISSLDNLEDNLDAEIYITAGSVTENATIPYPGTNSYYRFTGDITLAGNVLLVIEPGVLIDFVNQNVDFNINGTLQAVGTDLSPIQFVRLGGNVNNYGGRINVTSGSANSNFNYVNIDHLGYSSCALNIAEETTSVGNLNITNSNIYGLQISNASPTIVNSTFQGQQTGVYVIGGSPTLTNCSILGNSSYGIRNVGQDTVDARENWWGDISGPFHSTNPGGLGNQVSDLVLFDPVLNEPPNNTIVNAGILDLVQPNSDCNLSDSTTVIIELANFGNITQSNFDVGVIINESDTIVENVGNLNLLPGQAREYSFSEFVDLSTFGSYTIKAFISVANDSIPANDTLVNTIVNYSGITSPENLIPLDGTDDLEPTINFSWSPTDLSPVYNLYLWNNNDPEPTEPTFQNLTQISQIANPPLLQYGTDYNWKVEAVSGSCISTSTTQSFSTKEYPDIIVEEVTTPNTSFSGQNIEISWETKNTGNGSSGSSIWYDAVYFSPDPVYDITDRYLGAKPNIAALMPGESYTNDLTFTIPQGLQGNYYIIVRSDVYNSVVEADNANNNTAGLLTIMLTPPPDLQSDAILTPNNAFSEQAINVTWTIKNEGTGPTTVTDWNDRIYLSTDQTFNQSGSTLLSTIAHDNVVLLESDSSYTKTTSVTLPQGIFGDYYIHVVTDIYDDVYEYAFEDNNTGTSNVINVFLTPPPDLVVQNISTVEEINTNQSFIVEWENYNQGANVATGPWTDRIYVSALDTFNSAQVYNIGSRSFQGNLTAGTSMLTQQLVTMPNEDMDTAYVYIVTDVSNQVYEFNQEENNTLRGNPMIVKKPDLGITDVNISTPIFSGEDISITYTVENNGLGNVLSRSNRENFYFSDVFPFAPGTSTYLGANIYNLNLSTTQSISKQKTVSIPEGVSGNKYFYIITDGSSNIIESDETNNTYSETKTIQLSPSPDLLVENIAPLPDSILAGTTIPFEFVIANQGTADAANNAWKDKIYVSIDSVWDANDAVYLMEVERLEALAVNDSYTVNTEVTLPMLSLLVAGLDSFSYVYLYVVTDQEDQIYEDGLANENNINRSEAMHVTCPPPVDLDLLSVSSIEDSLLTGEEISITWMVQNIGSTTEYWDYPLWYDGFFLSLDTLFDSGDIFIEDFTIPGPLDQGAFYSETQSIEIPNTAAGSYYLLMVADHQDRNNDGDLTNNTKVIPVTSDGNPTDSSGTILIVPTLYPDLKAVSFNSPATAISGQPFEIIYTIENTGDTTLTDAWTDKVYLSTDNSIDNDDIIISAISQNIDLAPGEIWTDTIEAIAPVTQSGNRILLFKTDANNSINEDGSESNNILSSIILLDQPLPADLIVTSITAIDTIMVNEEIDLLYEVQNIGQNPANGFQNDVVYLSPDSLFDIGDYRVGIKQLSSNLSPLATETRTLAMATTPGVPIGDYHILVQADALNNINEIEETNNISVSTEKVHVTVPLLPLETTIANELTHLNSIFYKIEIPENLLNETLLVTLTGDPINGNNEIYLSHEGIPTRSSHDYAFAFPFSGNQELIVPELESGTYYLLIYGQHSEQATQDITVRAEIIDFYIQSIDSNEGGNTGTITSRIKGARFEENMEILLRDSILGEISSQAIYLNNSTSLFASFDLRGAAVGTYDVVVIREDSSMTILQNGFSIVEGSVGSVDGTSSGDANGFSCSIKNYGVDHLVSTDVLVPASVRIGRVVPITIVYGNNGNIDIPCPTRFVVSLRGAPLGKTITELEEGKEEIFITFEELNGPPGILRAGATGSITIYTKSTHPLRFFIQE